MCPSRRPIFYLTASDVFFGPREIKFGALMDRALLDPNALLATGTLLTYLKSDRLIRDPKDSPIVFCPPPAGHYARIDQSIPGQTRMLHATDISKDQSLFLASVPEEKLRRVSDTSLLSAYLLCWFLVQ